ncbi:FtsX-like permease family protein [Pseudoflavitalea sp. X16]|uniref:ABC transporter permease n=1 Tax=Paraflavitalea devenefica TaxID=2716334 RepID=UPI0014240E04|nr:ABC transporter permease [Paraflavitalea devenefica]NII28788.1 FtsX-like permease family protein [Paraflavitalea devenefica]
MIKTYFRIAWRNLVRNKTYSFLNVMGLALSITCGILIFSLAQYHLSFDNFHKDSSRIYRFVTEQHRDEVSYAASVPPSFGKAFRDDYSFGEQVARIATFENELISIQSGESIKKFKEPTGPAFAETPFFDIFNLPLGRGDIKTALAEPNTAVITENIARKYFGNEDPLNKVFRLSNTTDIKITGVLKDLPVNTDLRSEIYISWPTLTSYNNWFASDNAWGGISTQIQCFVRLRPGISPLQVEKVLPAYVKKYRPTSKNVHHYKLQPLSEMHFDGRYGGAMEKRNIWILSFIGLFLIITACVNFINLATAQALRRSKEIGIKKVLGSRRWSLFWQFIAETALITITATMVAIGLSYPLLPLVNEWFHTSMSINLLGDWQLWVFIPVLGALVTFLAGSYPGLVLSGFRPIMALKGKLSIQHIGGFKIRRTLIVAQFTISLILIMGMIVITQQMQYAKQSDLGFNKEAVVILPVVSDSTAVKMTTLRNKLANIPGVGEVSLCSGAPASESNWFNSIRFDTRTEYEAFRVNMKSADAQYLSTFDLKLVAGRNVFPSDTTREFLINEAMVRKLGLKSPQDAIGRKIEFNGGNNSAIVVGVLRDFHDRSFHEDINALALTTDAGRYYSYALKVNLENITAILAELDRAWSSMHPDRIYEYQFLDEQIAGFYETEATMLKLIRIFSFIAIFIGCLGLYGLVAFMVAQKTKEIGIRKVLGSSVAEILWIFGKEFIVLIFFAFLLAAPFAWWMMNAWLQDFEYHITIGPWVFVSAVGIILAVALSTVGYQSVKAALMKPVKSLRSE